LLRRIIVGEQARALSSAVVAEGRLAFISGQTPRRDGEFVHGSIEEQTEIVLGNVMAVLEAAGGRREQIVRCGCYLGDMNDFDGFDRTYRAFFGSDFPARTTTGATLYEGIKVEIDAVAVL
jgi:2-iminobutanoate/2-iminopropanoate deaminase